MTSFFKEFSVALESSGLDASLRRDGAGGWEHVWQSLPYQPVAYGIPMIDYQLEYFRGSGWVLEDFSLVLRSNGQPCGLWPLALGGGEGQVRLCSNGGPLMAPLFTPGLSPRIVKNISSEALMFARSFCASAGLPAPVARQLAQPVPLRLGVSDWHQQCMIAGARLATRHELFVDLQRELGEIRASFRRRYRSLINAGLRSWSVFELDHSDPDAEVWDQFKQLHLDVAGRRTRSDASWRIQFDQLRRGQAFLVGLRGQAGGRMVGGGFFQVTRDEGLYAVGAYDRTLFDKPLGHVVQQRAIERMKSDGLSWYRIGDRVYPHDLPTPTAKQLAIADFKQGFASHQICAYEFALPSLADGAEGAADVDG